MPQLHRFILHPLTSKVFLVALACAYLAYLVVFAQFVSASLFAPQVTISVHSVGTNLDVVIQHWSRANMLNAIDADQQIAQASGLAPTESSAGQAAKQAGQPASDGSLSYPLSTVGKVFFTTSFGQDSVCSGTAVVSSNQSVVDTAGHCLYWNGGWARNVIFCPLYENGATPYGCWAARALEVPSDWIDANPGNYHHDFGMAIVAPNSQGTLTARVGGVGWAYNQPTNLRFDAYGYPAAPPYDGQTRQSCVGSTGTAWQMGGGTVVSIPCKMTGGSSGGPWFVQIDGNWYLNGHNDFTSSIQYGHMFSPYYDDTWFALYSKAQQT